MRVDGDGEGFWPVEELQARVDPVACATEGAGDAVDAVGVMFDKGLEQEGFLDGREVGACYVFGGGGRGDGGVSAGDVGGGDVGPAEFFCRCEAAATGDNGETGAVRLHGNRVEETKLSEAVCEAGYAGGIGFEATAGGVGDVKEIER